MLRAACVYAPARRPGLPSRVAGLVQGRSGDPLPLRLLVQLQFPWCGVDVGELGVCV